MPTWAAVAIVLLSSAARALAQGTYQSPGCSIGSSMPQVKTPALISTKLVGVMQEGEDVRAAVIDEDIATLDETSGGITDTTEIRLRSGKSGQPLLDPTWIMKKCYLCPLRGNGYDPATNWYKSFAWTGSRQGTIEPISSCDVVALWIVGVGKVQDCAAINSPCSQQPYPPPAGHWGTPYKVHKRDGGCNEPIQFGDSIFFERMWESNWGQGYFLTERNNDLAGSSKTTVSSETIFTIEAPHNSNVYVTDRMTIRLVSEGALLTPTWIMRKCLSPHPESNWAPPSKWTTLHSSTSMWDTRITDCGVVALWIVGVGKVQDCAAIEGPCTQQPYPPPAGHWGSIYKVHVQNRPSNCGGIINLGDTVSFERMYHGHWGYDAHRYWLVERGGELMGGAEMDDQYSFTIQKA